MSAPCPSTMYPLRSICDGMRDRWVCVLLDTLLGVGVGDTVVGLLVRWIGVVVDVAGDER